MRRLLTVLACTAALAVGCGEADTEVSAPAASPSPALVTPKAALAALAESPAGGWPQDDSALGAEPPLPPGFTQKTLDGIYGYAKSWLRFGNLEREVWNGDTEYWARSIDVEGEIGVREALGTPETVGYVSAFDEGSRVLQARMKGAFSTAVGEADGDPTLRLTWRGTVVYAVSAGGGTGSLVPVWREVTWAMFDGGSYPAVEARASLGNVDVCAVGRTGLITPRRGDLDVEAGFYAAERKPEPTAQEKAEREADLAAC